MKNFLYTFILSLFILNLGYADTNPAKHGMVVSVQELATEVGLNVLRDGGNAVDAAVAVGYALAVVNPCCGNLGGGGFMTIHTAKGEDIVINFREKAPLAADQDFLLDKQGQVIPEKSRKGYTAVAIPGTVMGLDTALKKYGTLSRFQVMEPAIQLAEQGFILKPGDVKLLQFYAPKFKLEPSTTPIFLNQNNPYQSGDRLIQTDLANSLKQIEKQGAAAFYQGDIAKEIVNASITHDGVFSLKDFNSYHAEIMKPLTCNYHGYHIISAPPPSSGGIALCEILNILSPYTLKYHEAQSVHYMVEAMRHAFYDRNYELGDPDFVHNPTAILLSKDYAAAVRATILPMQATQIKPNTTEQEGNQTTHYSVLDQWGNAVSVTYTLNNFFGANRIAGHTGILLNNSMDDFTAKANSENQFHLKEGTQNLIAPGKRPLSSMSPTIVTKNQRVVMIIGSPGGPRIITSILEAMLNVLDFNMPLQAAVDAPRFHQQWMPDLIYTEANTFDQKTQQALRLAGYQLKEDAPWGAVEAIYRKPQSFWIEGANDRRRPMGAALGY